MDNSDRRIARTTVRSRSADDRYVLHEFALNEDWLSVYFVEVQDGAAVIAEIRVFPLPKTRQDIWRLNELLAEAAADGWRAPLPERPLTARVLREIQPGRALDYVREALAEIDPELVAAVHGLAPEALTAPRRPGRQGRSERFWAEIAAMYAEASANGSRRPVADVAERLSREGRPYSPSHVRDMIRKARFEGMLTPTSRGRGGGEITDKARAILVDRA